MNKKTVVAAAVCLLMLVLGGCSMLSPTNPQDNALMNGTTPGNIQNLGFAAKQDDALYFYYTGGTDFEIGDIVKSNPQTGEMSFVMHDGGFYINIYENTLYYCREDGIYRAPLDTLQAERVIEGKPTQLQISGGLLYYLEDGVIKAATTDGKTAEFSPIEGTECLNVLENLLFYIDSATGKVWQAEKDGSGAQMLFDVNAKQFVIDDNKLYYIDRSDEQIKRVSVGKNTPQTLVPYPCTSLNVNPYGMFYTREVDGQWVCCSADSEGGSEKVMENSAAKERHKICMFGGNAVIVREEDFETPAE